MGTGLTGAHRFRVEIDGLYVAGFSEVSGLDIETEVDDYREGGNNGYVHTYVLGTKYSNLVLKRGITDSELWNWYMNAVEGNIQRKNGSVVVLDSEGQETFRWNFYEAYPIKWTGPQLSAMSSEIAVESIELAHNGIKAVFS